MRSPTSMFIGRPRTAVARLAAVVGLGAIALLALLSARAEAADSCPNAAIRSQQASAQLADCRAYEQVSPVDKASGQVAFPIGRGNPLGAQSMLNAASPDGDTVAFWSYAAFAEPKTGLPAQYRARRSASGWQTEMWSPAAGFDHPWLVGARTQFVAATEDLATAFLATPDRLDPDDQDNVDLNFGSGFDVYSLSDAGLEWASRPNAPGPDAYPATAELFGRSEDGRQIYFNTPEALMPPAVQSEEAGQQLYMRADGVTSLVSVASDGSLLNTCGAALGDQDSNTGAGTTKRGAISADGSRVFFTTPFRTEFIPGSGCEEPKRLYMREGGETTEISKSQRPGGDGITQSASFQGATPSGDRVLFSSPEALTVDATPGTSHLYLYDVPSGVLGLVADHDVTVMGFSDDASRVYGFTGEEKAVNLYEGGEKIPVASTAGGPSPESVNGFPLYGRDPSVRTTADGRYLLFPSTANLTSFDSHGANQFYRFDAVTREIVCVTCNSTASVPLGDPTLGGDTSNDGLHAYPRIRNLSDDGQKVYFDTRDQLVPADANGVHDVYEWDSGRISLLSDGRSADPSVLFAVGRQGLDVFFGTTSALVSTDVDGGDYDIYDARVGGGFASTPAPPGCAGEGCQGGAGPAPAAAVIGTSLVAGGANPNVRKRCVSSQQRRDKAAKRAARRSARSKADAKSKGAAKRKGCTRSTRGAGK